MDKIKQGKQNKARGRRFETLVRKDLESKGWIVSKWPNQVEIENDRLVPAKHKFNFFTKVMSLGTGFPDFIGFRRECCPECVKPCGYSVIGIEAKSAGYLDKKEKEKVKWLLDKDIFEFILIAFRGDKRGQIVYEKNLKGGIIIKHNGYI